MESFGEMTSGKGSCDESPNLVRGLSDIACSFDVILCDVWGVVHDGRAAFPEACRALEQFRRDGGTVVLLTNAPRPRKPILTQLKRLGAPPSAFDALVTSGDVTLAYIEERGEAPVLHIGPERDLALFEALKEQTGFSPPRVGLADASYVLCTGLDDDDVESPDDYRDSLTAMRARELDFICANPDLVVHVGDRLVYCAGALAERYEALGGRVLQAGKPYSPIYQRALGEAETIRGRPVAKERILAIGDAMRTDILGASNAGISSLLIASGIHRDELMTSQGELDPTAYAALVRAFAFNPTRVAYKLTW